MRLPSDTSNVDQLSDFFKQHAIYKTSEISQKYGIPVSTVRLWKRRCGFKSQESEHTKKLTQIGGFFRKRELPNSVPREVWNTKAWFYEHYIDKKIGMASIARITGLSRRGVEYYLRRFGIKIRTLQEAMKSTNSYNTWEWCNEMYNNKLLPICEMARIAEVSPHTILNWLTKYGIQIRDRKTSMQLRTFAKQVKWKSPTDT